MTGPCGRVNTMRISLGGAARFIPARLSAPFVLTPLCRCRSKMVTDPMARRPKRVDAEETGVIVPPVTDSSRIACISLIARIMVSQRPRGLQHCRRYDCDEHTGPRDRCVWNLHDQASLRVPVKQDRPLAACRPGPRCWRGARSGPTGRESGAPGAKELPGLKGAGRVRVSPGEGQAKA
jgi:hypothetical protein